MTRTLRFGLVLLALLGGAASCGDNSLVCGPGTDDIDGVCTGPGSGLSCGAGTMADTHGHCVPICGDGTVLTSAGCVVDPTVCQDGTVLVAGTCVDAGRVSVDVQESAEPNGMGLLGEDSHGIPAGEVTLKAIGSGATVLHGTISPHAPVGSGGTTPDVDTFTVTVAGPTALDVSVDGVGGLLGGFVALSATAVAPDPLAAFDRVGVNLTGDTAHRQLFLPAAGTYLLAITDARTLFYPGEQPYGGPSAEYYVSITQLALPAPVALSPVAGDATFTLTTGALGVFGLALGSGSDTLQLTATDSSVVPGITVFTADGATLLGAATGEPASVTIDGGSAGATVTVVVDPALDAHVDAATFTLHVSP